MIDKRGAKNVFQYAAIEERVFENIAAENGYERKTTFFADLSIAEWCGNIDGVEDTYNNVVNSWKNNVEYFTEFVLALNWKSWEHEKNDKALSMCYADLYYKADEIALSTFKGKDLEYYYHTID